MNKISEAAKELKACPYCGSTNFNGPHKTEYIGDSYHPHWWIECNNCPANMEEDGETPDHLIFAWNRRDAIDTATAELRMEKDAEIERLKEYRESNSYV